MRVSISMGYKLFRRRGVIRMALV